MHSHSTVLNKLKSGCNQLKSGCNQLKSGCKDSVKNSWRSLTRFLFAQGHQEQLGYYRFFLASILFYIACFRQFNMDNYSVGAMIPRDHALALYPDFYRPFFQWFWWQDSWASGLHLLLIFLLLLTALGLSHRILMLLTWVLYQGFMNRNYAIQFGADMIGGLFFFYLSWTRCHDYFSLKNVLKKKWNVKESFFTKTNLQHNPDKFTDQLSSVFFRLIQFQLAIIYAYTGFEKLKGSTWWDGTALWTVFANPQFAGFDLTWLRHFPLFFAIGTFTTIVFEVYFPVMVAFEKTRKWWLLLGIIFHLQIGLFLGLMPFSLVMMSTYLLYLNRLEVKHLEFRIKSLR